MIQKRLDYVQQKILETNLNALQKYTPVKSGYMLSRYKIEQNLILNDCAYFWFVNDGTRFFSGRHFVQLATAQTKTKIPMIFNQAKKLD